MRSVSETKSFSEVFDPHPRFVPHIKHPSTKSPVSGHKTVRRKNDLNSCGVHQHNLCRHLFEAHRCMISQSFNPKKSRFLRYAALLRKATFYTHVEEIGSCV